jgi:hypothetical protein
MEKFYWKNYINKNLQNIPVSKKNDIFFTNSLFSEYYSPENYFYKINKDGYRSIDFDNEVEILAVGCSNTVGVGLPFEYTWPKIMNLLIPDKNIKNLSIPGASIQSLVSKVFNYINKYSPPKAIVCLFPTLERYSAYNSKKDLIETFYINQSHFNHSKKDFLNENFVIHLTFEYIKMLEILCKSLNIKLIWSFWGLTDKLFDYSRYQINDKDKDSFKYAVKNKYELKDSFNSFHFLDIEPDFFSFAENCFFNSNKVLEYNQEFNNTYFKDKNYKFYKDNIQPEKNKELIKSYESLGYSYDSYCQSLFTQFEDCLDFAYDRYKVPAFYQSIEVQKLWSKEKMEKIKKETISKDLFFAHPGLKFNIFWAEEITKALSS